MKHALAIFFAVLALLAMVDAKPKAEKKGVTFFELEFQEKREAIRIYKIKGTKELNPTNSDRIRRAFDAKELEPPELLDVLVDYFAVRIDGELLFVVEMEHRGFTVFPAKESEGGIERPIAGARLLGKLPNVKDLLKRDFREGEPKDRDK
ncbi:hypothetical protein HAHE_26000 [Haloferula helveola]|uniref:Uncharacterized protein n=1 Tax=Haloferula helveola TaxID=490095 RepID=A0ABM7RAR6_9BACT|nr:hypothetical protein HAHE_24320 [Haloferula helveola]BCX48534.1 hypothetical protein HAHE_24420 [Haloferula helveola]BCX48692.1 hypothetical protein HAHE_26000 [Haloferula helveola]